MESYEATRAVFSRVQSIDPENASKIMGFILLHHGEKDMIRFALGPETLIVSVVDRAKIELELLSNTSSALVGSHISNPIAISKPNPLSFSLPSPRLTNNGFNPSSPSSPSVWPYHQSVSPNANHSLSYAAVVNGTCNTKSVPFSSPSTGSTQVGFTANNNGNREIFVDEYHLQDKNLSFVTDPLVLPPKNVEFLNQNMDLATSPGCRSESVVYPYCWENSNGANNNACLQRSSSFNDAYFGTDDSTYGLGYKPCLYYARGFCKNGSTCKFVHDGEFSDSGNNSAAVVGSPYDAFDPCHEEILRSKFAQQQRLAAQLTSSGVNLPYNKLNYLQFEAQRSAAAALMIGDEFNRLNRVRMARNEFSVMGVRGESNPAARQIYLTFPADSTFKEEDVSHYFSRYGPVQDVRIPYQQKRMFGFVTFVYPETVNIILAKGNPHFVCDSRVLVKPYKEKGKLPDKKQLEKGELSCSSSPGLDLNFQIGARMFYSTQEMLLKKKLEEQADLQQALDLQSRRLMNLQLFDLKNRQHHWQNVSMGSPVPSLNVSQVSLDHNVVSPSDGISQDVSKDTIKPPTRTSDQQLVEDDNAAVCDNNSNVHEDKFDHEESELPESFEHVLPDSLFASPTKSVTELQSSVFSAAPAELTDGTVITGGSSMANSDSSTSLNMASRKSCSFELPRLSSGLESWESCMDQHGS